MAAMLRVRGTSFEPDRFIASSDLTACRIWRRGEPRRLASRPNGERHDESGINIVCSDANFDEFGRQVPETIEFLESHRDELRRLREFPGVETLTLDFGIERRDVIAQFDYFPPELIRLAAEFGMGIELSQYPVGESIDNDRSPDAE